jgi:cyanophycin synthetase
VNILSINAFRGRNVYCMKPVVKLIVELEEGEDSPTSERPGFDETLLGALPGLRKHYCSLGREGGFAERLSEGTYLAHVAEHVILEMQYTLGYDVAFGKTRRQDGARYQIVFQYENEPVAVACARLAIRQLQKLWVGEGADFAAEMEELRGLAARTDPGPSTRAILSEAARRGIPATRLGGGSLLQLGYGKFARRVQASLTDFPSCVAVDAVSDKQLTKDVLSALGIPVPDGCVAHSPREAVGAAEEIGYPVVVKPLDGNHGSGVSTGLQNARQVEEGYEKALQVSCAAIVEKHIEGQDYRVLVVGGRVAAVAERKPPQIVGDGLHTIRSLVELENQNPMRGEGHSKPLTRIELDEDTVRLLHEGGFSPSSVPAEGTKVVLRRNANLSTGGTARSVRDIHPKNAEFAVQAAKALGLDVAGIDICSKDIAVPLTENGGAILEVNAGPGLRMHLSPTEGQPVDVAKDIVSLLFPEGKPFAVPIVSVTGTNGKTTTVRLIARALKLQGLSVGMTTTSGIYVGEACVAHGDNTGALSAGAVLALPEVEAAVLETARGGIVRRGLGYDLADVALVTNISNDHLGQDGLETLEDIAHVKALVVEAVKPNGWAVLNADDPMVQYFAGRARCGILYFSWDEKNPRVAEHLEKGGRAVCLRGNKIMAFEGGAARAIVAVGAIPITYGGKAACNIENAMAAAAALLALNVPDARIREALTGFMPDERDNPGRFNIFQLDGYKVMLDYGHNVAGYEQVIQFLEKQDAERLVGVIGVPGDRMDEAIGQVGALCARHFDKLIVKEDADRRGRAPGEVARILKTAAQRAKAGRVDVVLEEKEALAAALAGAKKGDFITVFYEKYEPLRDLILECSGELVPGEKPGS